MKRTAFLAVALLALMAVGLYAQTEADFDTDTSSDGKSITITKYKGKVTEVKIPEKIKNLPVTVIGDSAFRRTTITSVTIPSSVTEINHWGFNQCVLLTSITIPKTITKIGNEAFYRCSNLTSVMFEGTIASSEFDGKAFDGDLRDKFYATDKAKGTPGTYTTTDTSNINSKWTKSASATSAPAAAGTAGLAFTAINNNKEYSVAKGTVTSGAVVIPASYNNLPVTEITNDAFKGTQITAVTIPDSVKTINNSAFVDCKELTSVTIPDSVTSIGIYAFRSCPKLTSVTIGKGVTSIGNNAFGMCTSLTSVTFVGSIPSSNFNTATFGGLGDLRDKHLAGGAGTYTRPSGGETWTKK